eukprot:1180784-Prorocentrum_minimum.AAC.2
MSRDEVDWHGLTISTSTAIVRVVGPILNMIWGVCTRSRIGSGGGSAALLGLVFLPFIWSIPLALMTAEFATMMPEAGGHIIWVDKALGPYAGTLVGNSPLVPLCL